jgi:hypothetical protein
MGGKQAASSAIPSPSHDLLHNSSSLASLLVAVSSVPISLIFALGVQGDPSAYIISLISFGLLASVDLRTGLRKAALGFTVSLLVLFYTIETSIVGQRLAPLVYGELTLFLVALPPALAVLVSGLLISTPTKHKMVKANLLATFATSFGFSLGAMMKVGFSAPSDSLLLPTTIFILLGLAANTLQTLLLEGLDKLSKTRKFSLAMMPTAFFAYNSVAVYAYFISPNATQAYLFFSSLAFLPLLALTGKGALGLAERVVHKPATRPAKPTITIGGEHLLAQGHVQTIKVNTDSRGQPKDVASIEIQLSLPNGKRETLKLSHASTGKYTATYQPRIPGSYKARINATTKEHMSSNESFSFTVQQPVPQQAPIQRPPPPAQPAQKPFLRLHQPFHSRPPTPVPVPPVQHITPSVRISPPPQGNSKLNNWDPKAWVGQEVHGYRIIQHIATGATGYILRATFGQAGTETALKIPILKTGSGTTALDETMSEATRLLELSGQSKYIVQIRGILVDRLNVQEIVKGNTSLYLQSPPAIVMEFMKGGNAKRLLGDPSYDSLSYSEKWGSIVVLLGHMIASALDTIHNAGFAHLDVKPQNILFNADPPANGPDMMSQIVSGALVPKLGDLGSAVKIGGKVVQFTSEYAPAEQVLGSAAATPMDVYQLGATIFTMLTKTPVHPKKLVDAMDSLVKNPESGTAMNDLRTIWNSFTPDFSRIDPKLSPIVSLLKDMLSRDPRHRPRAGEVSNSFRKLADSLDR